MANNANNMKANAHRIHDAGGTVAVEEWAETQENVQWTQCRRCHDVEPHALDGTCLVCGTVTTFQDRQVEALEQFIGA